MFTPAITASSVSAPPRIISFAFAQAARPFALEITTGFFAPAPWPALSAGTDAAIAADPAIHCRRFIMI
jgi:hypothetical protein